MGSFTAGAGTSYLLSSTAPVPSGTANGVLFLNASKVMTSGSALTFDGTSLGVGKTGATPLDMVGTFRWNSNVAGTDIWQRFTGGAGLIYDGTTTATDLAWIRNGAEQMRLTNTGLGIGTSSPLGKLDVREANRANSTNITNIVVYTTTAQAADVGGTIGLGGIFDGASGYAPFGSIRGGKENSTINNYAGYLAFQTISNGGTLSERMRLDSSGNLGLGVTPSAWVTGYRAFQTTGTTLGSNSSNGTYYTQNAFFDGTNWVYIANTAANRYQMLLGIHSWHTAASGTAGNPISFTQAMTLDASGRLMVGTTTAIGTITSGGPIAIAGSPGGLGGSNRYIGAGGSTDSWYLNVPSSGSYQFARNESVRVEFNASGDFVFGPGAIATNATSGFVYVPGCAGTPTGTPTAYTGRVPIVVDTTNNKLYFYSGGAWRDAGP